MYLQNSYEFNALNLLQNELNIPALVRINEELLERKIAAPV
jgi:hypothetical protein